MFAEHYLDDPINGDTQTLGGWSYVWAGLLGPLYVLVKGFPLRALAMLGICLAIWGAAAGTFVMFAGGWQDNEAETVAAVLLAVIALMAEAAIAVELVRRGFLRMGYRKAVGRLGTARSRPVLVTSNTSE